jgi:hypothetical protein
MVLEHMGHLWQDTVSLISDHTYDVQGETFFGHAELYAYVKKDGLRYGSALTTRGHQSCFAYIDNRQPVQIDYIFSIDHERPAHSQPAEVLHAICAIVRPLVAAEDSPELPWDMW